MPRSAAPPHSLRRHPLIPISPKGGRDRHRIACRSTGDVGGHVFVGPRKQEWEGEAESSLRLPSHGQPLSHPPPPLDLSPLSEHFCHDNRPVALLSAICSGLGIGRDAMGISLGPAWTPLWLLAKARALGPRLQLQPWHFSKIWDMPLNPFLLPANQLLIVIFILCLPLANPQEHRDTGLAH